MGTDDGDLIGLPSNGYFLIAVICLLGYVLFGMSEREGLRRKIRRDLQRIEHLEQKLSDYKASKVVEVYDDRTIYIKCQECAHVNELKITIPVKGFHEWVRNPGGRDQHRVTR